jgi:hypothetical protein
VEPDRGLPDALDQIEHVGAFLIAHGIAEDAPKQPDIVPQPGIFLKRQNFVGAVGPDIDVGRHDLGRHGWLLQKLPGNPLSRNFWALAQEQEKGERVL